MSHPADVFSLEPEDLDGHTIEELEDYLERNRQPADSTIDNSPSCQIALSALQRLTAAAATYLEDDDDERESEEPSTEADEDWISTVLSVLPLEVRRGRLFPIPIADPSVDAHITEAALRGLIRATGDAIPGLLIGAITIDLCDPEPLADVTVEIALVYGTALAAAETALRTALIRALDPHAPFAVRRINIHVRDVIVPRATRAKGRRR